jgi:hypothetical protein
VDEVEHPAAADAPSPPRARSGPAATASVLRRGRALRFGATSLVGLLACTYFVGLTARMQSGGARHLLGRWAYWTARFSPWQREPKDFRHGGLVVLVAAVVLVLAWLVGAWLIQRDRLPWTWVASVAVLWSLPVVLAPPILSQDAYAYLAQGAVASGGGSPYQAPSAVLGAHSALVQAVDPLYRGRVAPYGPVAVRLFSFALWAGHQSPPVALGVLRALAVLCVVMAVLGCIHLAGRDRSAMVVWVVAASPLILLHLVGGLHVEAELGALLVAALVLHRRGLTQLAAAVIVVAAAIKVTVIAALAVLLLDTWRRRGWRRAGLDVLAALAAAAVLSAALRPTPFGWLPALGAPLRVWDPVALPTSIALLWGSVTETSPVLAVGPLRLIVAVVGIGAALWCLATIDRRPVEASVGMALTAVLLTGPVLWPWYLAPAIICLAAWRGRGLMLLLALTCASALTALPMPVKQMQRVTAVTDVVVLLTCAIVVLVTRRRSPRGQAAVPDPPGDLAVGSGPRAGSAQRLRVGVDRSPT